MGSIFRKTVTRTLPKGAEIIVRDGQRLARWKPAKGKVRTKTVTTGKDGTDRIVTVAATFTVKYRDGSNLVREIATGCRDEQAARQIMADLERRAELVKAGVMTTAEDSIADHQSTLLTDHVDAFFAHQQSRGVSKAQLGNTRGRLNRVVADVGLVRLSDLSAVGLERWLSTRKEDGMGAVTRNAYREAWVTFGNWCVRHHRLTANPFADVPKADTKSDRRHQRRALTEDELCRLIFVGSLRPLAEFGREAVRKSADEVLGRRTWEKAALTFETIADAANRGRVALRDNSRFLAELERRGRERGLIYKTLILTGLRRGELASLTVGQLELDGPVPFARLNAADEKNRQGNSIPLRADLVADLREWLEAKLHDERTAALRNGQVVPSRLGPDTPIVNVPASLVRTLDRDLQAAGIPKRDERGRVVDVHALRHSFGTMLSRNGVAPRTAQAALRHSTIDLTMNVYTDPKLLDIHGALESLPKFDLENDPRPERIALKSTGTDPNPLSLVAPTVAPDVARNVGNPRKSLSLAVQTSTSFESIIRSNRTATDEGFIKQNAVESSTGSGSV